MGRQITTSKFSFEQLIMNDWLYVDKTEYVWKLVNNHASTFFFCSRPRRFGKSLFISTLESVFKGRKDLFRDLYIGATDYSFRPYPVLHFDFSDLDLTSYEDFRESLQQQMRNIAMENGAWVDNSSPGTMLDNLLKAFDDKVVVLIDEFDAPVTRILSYKDEDSLAEKIRQTFSSFYSKLKSNEDRIRFLFITGVTKLSNMSIFSQMNNLTDISMDQGFAGAFGYTQKELEENFDDAINEKLASDECPYHSRREFLAALRSYYDGYRFSNCGASSFIDIEKATADEVHEIEEIYGNSNRIPSVYNPVSIGMYFSQGNPAFMNFWDWTGVSTLAVELARSVNLLDLVEENASVSISAFTSFDVSSMASGSVSRSAVLALLYYTGYLTQDGVSTGPVTLRFPNIEVASSFTGSLVTRYSSSGNDIQTVIDFARNALKDGRTEDFIHQMKVYLSNFSYELLDKDRERQYQLLFLSLCVASGLRVEGEKHTDRGRIDVQIESPHHIYIIEMKFEDTADCALSQISDRKYHYRFLNDAASRNKTVHLLGISFSCSERNIREWKEKIITSENVADYMK